MTTALPPLSRRTAIGWLAGSLASFAAQADAPAWQRTLAQARGQTVYFNAWGGAPTINAYIQDRKSVV